VSAVFRPRDSTRQYSLDLVGGVTPSPPASTRRQHRRGVARCDSPLERQLAFAFSRAWGFQWRRPSDHPCELGGWERLSLVLLAQPAWSYYTPDFAIVRPGWRAQGPLPMVIEVDGRDFHERTREQAEHDRARDRFMTGRGAVVLRFTGSEVWRDAGRCVEEVMVCASKLHAAHRRQQVGDRIEA